MRHLKSLFLTFALLFVLTLSAQLPSDSICYEVEGMNVSSFNGAASFWQHSTEYGKITDAPNSGFLLLGLNKNVSTKHRKFDYGFNANGLVQYSGDSKDVYFHELYATARLLVFDLTVGSREEFLGNQDSSLSGGGLMFSRNARPMPKIAAGIEQFADIPFTQGYAQIKGAVSHGWFSKDAYEQGAYLHHKWGQIRFGGKLPVHFQYGFEHIGIWGGTIPGYGLQPSSVKDLLSVFLARSGGSDVPEGEQINAMGNHIISQSMRLDVDIAEFKIGGYWQNIAEDNPIRLMWETMNTADGLWGVTIRNTKFPIIKGIIYEYLNTTDQSGPYHDKDGIVYGGSDGYFTNYIYRSGWTYRSRMIGTPFVSNFKFDSQGRVIPQTLNNRVQVHHFGIEGSFNGFLYKTLASFSKNYGQYGLYPLSENVRRDNTSLLLEINKKFSRLGGVEIGCSLGSDYGSLYGNTFGIMFSIKKAGNLFKYGE